MANNQTFGRVLRAARGLRSLRSVAAAAEISPAYLSDIENDRRIPAEAVIDRLAKVLDLQADLVRAWSGRIGEKAERYFRRQPAAVILVRKIADQNLSDIELTHLSATVDEMRPMKKGKAKR
jgi:transcriptional regulator with XRE-family HTH domain